MGSVRPQEMTSGMERGNREGARTAPAAGRNEPPAIASWGDGFGRTPAAWKAAVVVGVLGWSLVLGSSTTTSINGVEDCTGTNLGPVVVAAVVALLAIVGWRRTTEGHPARRLPRRAAWIGLGVLGALVVVHVLRLVVAPAGGVCS